MSSPRAIGGYFEIESRPGEPFYSDIVELNSARNGLEYILRSQRPKRVHMPKYTCDVILEPLEKLNIEYVFYALDANLEIVGDIDVADDELIVYTNYFGVKNAYSKTLGGQFGPRLVVDCSQAFYYARTRDEHVIYSPRKFFGVADGGYVVTDKRLDEELDVDVSYERMRHLLKRVDVGPEEGYADFKTNDESLVGQPIKQMSKLTKKLLSSIDYDAAKNRRNNNFRELHRLLGHDNILAVDIDDIDGPMVYPFMVQDAPRIKERLIQNRIFVPTYWPNVFTWCNESELEYQLARDIVAIPIDQRYDSEDMKRIGEVLYEN